MQLGLSLLGPSVEVLGFLSHVLKSLIIIEIFIDKTDISKSLFSEQCKSMNNGKKIRLVLLIGTLSSESAYICSEKVFIKQFQAHL